MSRNCLRIDAVDLAYQNIRAIEGLLLGQQLRNLILLELTAQFLDLSFQFFLAIQQFLDFLHSVVGAAANQIADLFELLFIAAYEIQGPLTGKSLDASDTGCYAALERKLENANFPGTLDVGAAAQLRREIPDLNYTHPIAVLIAEKC